MGRPVDYYQRNVLGAREAQIITQVDKARRLSMELSNTEFLKRIRAEHERAGRYVA
jgi:hypothetical protein